MDSKSSPPKGYDSTEDLEPPPTYSAAPPTYSTSSAPTTQYYSTQIQTQLSTLTTQISTTLTQNTLLSTAHDEKILSLLTYHIQSFLTTFANTGLYKGQLILIPLAAIPDPKAVPADYDFRDPEQYDSVIRVSDKQSDGYGEPELWFWNDEEMARRLARYLKPKTDPRTLELPERKEVHRQVETPNTPSPSSPRGFWGRIKGGSSAHRVATPPPRRESDDVSFVNVRDDVMEAGDKVVMNVKAEEVDFRTENECGIYGTERGWAIVVNLKVTMGSR